MMTFMQRLFAAAGLIAVGVIAVTSWSVASQRAEAAAEKQFVALLMSDLSSEWALARIGDRLSPRAVRQLATSPLPAWLREGHKLGRFRLAETMRSEGAVLTRTHSFRARFQNGNADVRVVLGRSGQTLLVEALDVTVRDGAEGPNSAETALQ